LLHNRRDCLGSGFCELGCAFDAKQNALKVLVPSAIEAGAQVYADCRATRIVLERGRVAAVEAELLGADGRARGTLTVRCRAVCLSGSAIGSAELGIRSALPDPYRHLGRHLRLHPGSAVVGVLRRPVEGWSGIPQAYECTEFLRFEPGSDRRVWLLPAFAHPIGFASLLPGFGRAHRALVEGYANFAVASAMLHDESEGTVGVEDGRLRIRYWPDRADRRQMLLGLAAAARILLAGGAERVLVPGLPPREVRTDRQTRAIERGDFGRFDLPLTAVHPMGPLRMSARARDGALNPDGRHHQVPNLWVADGSLFPTSIGVPPQISIYAFAHRVAARIVAALAEGN
jgi:choline dehydrogenase-like flavoprotein